MPNGNGQGDFTRQIISRDNNELLTLLTKNQGKQPEADLEIGQGRLMPVWSPQLGHPRTLFLTQSNLAAAAAFTLTWNTQELDALFQSNIGEGIVTSVNLNRSAPKIWTLRAWFFTVAASLAGNTTWSMDIFYVQTQASGIVRYGIADGISLTQIPNLSVNLPRVQYFDPVIPLPVPQNTTMINVDVIGGTTEAVTDSSRVTEMTMQMNFSQNITLSLIGLIFDAVF